MDVGLLAAFVGGVLALLSPCAALLLPAFFSATVGSGPRLVLHGAVFYVGMLLVLVPLGLGVGVFGGLLMGERRTIVLVASVVMVALGVLQLLGLGLDPSRLLPGGDALRSRAATGSGLAGTIALGAVSGVAGVCAGPILGAVLTVAAARGDALAAGVLLAAYGAGMVVPLLLIAASWHRLGPRGRGVLRGRGFRLLGRELHTTSVVTGLLIIAVGVLFWATNGLVGLPEVVPLDVQARLQEGAAVLADPAVDVIAVVVLACLALVGWGRRRRRAAISPDGPSCPHGP